MTVLSNSEKVKPEQDAKAVAKARIAELVQKCRDINSKTGRKRKDFSEEDTATKFIRPFLEALGWDFGDIDEVMEQITLRDKKRRQRLDCVLYLPNGPFAVIEYKQLVGSGSVDSDYNFEYVIQAAGKLGAKYAVLSRFSEVKIITLDTLEEHRFEVAASSDYQEKFEDLWDLLSKESAVKSVA